MHSLPALLLAMLAVTVTTAVDPLYQTPGRVEQVDYVEPDYTECVTSTFNLIGDGEILLSDCQAILKDLESSSSISGFVLALSLWKNSTAKVDHFWTYVTSGSCQFALKRTDGFNDTVYVGDADFKNILNHTISLGNGTHVQTVEGTLGCASVTETAENLADLEWTVRQTGNVN